jgi:mannose-6-phosphate isomerase
VDLLRPEIQPYAWGSHTAIAQLQGRPYPTQRPEAELWMGAHPSAPSGLERDGMPTTLEAVIAADPVAELGAAVASEFGGRLPFLLKVLAADKALSIQVHPSRAQAQAGYKRENELGVRARNYVDDWPKPELLCALTRFEALAGFRSPADAAALLTELAVDRLAPVASTLVAAGAAPGQVAAQEQADVLATILRWPDHDRQALIAEVVAACRRLAESTSHYAATGAALTRVAADHPGDIGIVAALLLNYRVLEPGEAVFMPAGGLHAYLQGTGIELLANSDNVLRAGLTAKHIDVEELLALTDPGAEIPVVKGRQIGPGVEAYDTPAPEFALFTARLTEAETTLPGAGPRLVLATEGTAILRTRGETLKVGRGESAFLTSSDGATMATGPGHVFVAAPGTPG